MEIEDQMPLKNKAQLVHILPCLGRCMKKPKPPFKHQLRMALLNEMDLLLPENAEEIEEDPYLLLGYGINAYFEILIYCFQMCIWLTVFTMPLMYFYSNNHVNYFHG